MMSILYFILFMFTTGNLVYLAQKEYKHIDRYLWTLVVVIPIIDLGYWFKSTVHEAETAMVAMGFIYLASCVALSICLFIVMQEVGLKTNGVVKICVYGITTAHLLSIWMSKDSTLYYSSIEIKESFMGSATIMTSGPLKFTHYIYLGLLCLGMLVALIYGIKKEGKHSKRIVKIFVLFLILGTCLYSVEVVFDFDFSLLPIVYSLGSSVATQCYDHFQSRDLMSLIGEKQSRTGLRGFASFDKQRCLLEYNNQFLAMVPEIAQVRADEKIVIEDKGLISQIYPAIDLFENENVETQDIAIADKIYSMTISAFSVSLRMRYNGYLVEVADITEETRRKDIIAQYNESLSKAVKEKTEHIAEIQNTVVLGLANMVENRDDNTGGHVKRTSDVIKFLVDEIIRRKTYAFNEQTAADIIRAAPMHDLGKIAIDNSILCKPAKLTDEEFTMMKTHAPKSGEIVKIILEGVEEQHFVDVAFNVARHHHERWDGKGYPEGLLGEKIPVEARIMAVADVYDALVSKRCYKEAMSFEKAFGIMNECMGSQFDPAMRPIFIACREKLEEYYREANGRKNETVFK